MTVGKKRMVLGLDEVGRGCWAGPLVAGAVILKHPIVGVKDSKLLTRLQREKLDKTIRKKALAIGLGWVQPTEIDQLGITGSVREAMRRALAQISLDFDAMIIDGIFNFFPEEPRAQTLAKADRLIPAVSAASIIAKVARDQFMRDIAREYPQYGFERHVGYGTAAHVTALRQYGICNLHRRSYKPIQEILEFAS